MNKLSQTVVAFLSLVSLGGCAPLNSVHWKFPGPGESQVFSTDPYQRHLIMTKDTEGQIRACSEASPDAMTVFSSSLTGRGILGPTDREVEAASAFGQTAATIERTQTINMLREWMFRTCELWLSGALDKQEFLTRSARDHRSMITILSVEQLTGVVKPPSTIISGPAVTATAAQGQRTAELVDAYRQERVAAEATEKTANTAFADANDEHDDGAGTKKRICEFDKAPANGVDAYNQCKAAEQSAATAKTAADTARAREKQVLDQMGALSAGLAAAVSAGTNNAGGLGDGEGRMSDEQLRIIGAAVERIALTSGVDEALMFCVTYLRDGADEGTRAICNEVVADAAASDRMLLDPNNSALQAILRNPAAIGEGRVNANVFNAFRSDLLTRIDATQTRLPERMAEFERLAGLAQGTLSTCVTPAECRQSVVEMSLPLQANFNAAPPSSQDKFRDALRAFDN